MPYLWPYRRTTGTTIPYRLPVVYLMWGTGRVDLYEEDMSELYSKPDFKHLTVACPKCKLLWVVLEPINVQLDQKAGMLAPVKCPTCGQSPTEQRDHYAGQHLMDRGFKWL